MGTPVDTAALQNQITYVEQMLAGMKAQLAAQIASSAPTVTMPAGFPVGPEVSVNTPIATPVLDVYDLCINECQRQWLSPTAYRAWATAWNMPGTILPGNMPKLETMIPTLFTSNGTDVNLDFWVNNMTYGPRRIPAASAA